jgi:hypothetical protein
MCVRFIWAQVIYGTHAVLTPAQPTVWHSTPGHLWGGLLGLQSKKSIKLDLDTGLLVHCVLLCLFVWCTPHHHCTHVCSC